MQELLDSVASLGPRERKALAAMLAKKGINLFGITPIQPRDRDEPALLSHAQERQWFLWRLDPQGNAYNMAATLRVRGALDVPRLQAAFQGLVERHEVLRTTFVEQQAGPVQVIAGHLALHVEHLPGSADEAQVRRQAEAFHARPFDLANGPLLRVAVLECGPQEHVLLLTQHHIISDGSSTQQLIREVMALYQGEQLPAPTLQYADHAAWQRQWLNAGERERQLAWWRERLGGEASVLPLPFDRPRPLQGDSRGAAVTVRLPAALVTALKARARASDATLFMWLLAAFQGFLYRYSGQADVRVGVPVAGRGRPELEGLLGLFVNTQVYRTQVDGQGDFTRLLGQVMAEARQAQSYQELPFEQLVEALQPQRQLNVSPLFQILFNYQGAQVPATGMTGLQLEYLDWAQPAAPFDLTLYMRETGDALEAEFIYPTALFDAATVQRLLDHWQVWLQALVADQGQRIDEVALLGEGERAWLLQAWNPPASELASPLPVHEQFVQQALRTPQATALVYAGQAYSYGQLEQASRALAQRLQGEGLQAEERVGLAVRRGPALVVGLLGILRAGAAYVPLDPEFPAQRLDYMLEQSGVRLLLSEAAVLAHLRVPAQVRSLGLDDWAALPLADTPLVAPIALDQLAYTLYTSGSTGQPKGVMISHRALNNFIAAMGSRLGLASGDRLLSMTTFSFDIFGLELYLPLVTGGVVVLASQEQARDPLHLRELLAGQPVKAIQATPSAWRMLLDSGLQAALRDVLVLCGGEALPPDLLARLQQLGPQVWNLYGPTETTIWSSAQCISAQDREALLGQPLDNTVLHVLGPDLAPAPLGAAGELLIGGLGLARGYLGRPGLTAERFVPDPARSGQRLYRTGDVARYRPCGALEYLGRADQQVKVRGFRIELGDIEAQLLLLPGVREAAVKVVESPEGAQLAAWVVVEETALVGSLPEQLRRELGQRLPGYMVPGLWQRLTAMPRTPNGKLDRNALPAIASAAAESGRLPATELERSVAAVWEQVLGVQGLTLEADFFGRGGHSLLATRITSRLREQLGLEVPLRVLFEHSQLGDFIAALQAVEQGSQAMARAPEHARRRPSFAQERQWLLWRLQPDSHAYTLPAGLRLRGTLDIAALNQAFDALIERHEPLRSRFIATADGVEIDVLEQLKLPVSVQRIEAAGLAALIDEQLRQPFDLAEGPLLRLTVATLDDDQHVLLLTQHHIVSDAWSMQLMIEELLALYGALREGRAAELAPLQVNYCDYAWWQRQWLASSVGEQQLAYWRGQLGEEQPVLALPFDRPRPARPSLRGGLLSRRLGPALSAAVAEQAQAHGCTPFMLLLAAYQVLLWRYSGQADIRVGVPVAGRNRLETERLIGFFVNTQVHRAQLQGSDTFAGLLAQVRETALQAQQHQDLPFEQLVEALQPQRSLAHTPLFQVLFNHHARAAEARWQAPLAGLEVQPLSWPQEAAKFDLTLETQELDGDIEAAFIHASDLFDASTIERLADHYLQLLQAFVGQPGLRLGEPVLAAGPMPVLEGAVTHEAGEGVYARFEQQVRANPERLALVEGQQRVSFAQLHQRVLGLAALLEEQTQLQARVAVVAERSIGFVAAVLACLRQGRVFVPVDPQQGERARQVITDSAAALLLGDPALAQGSAGLPVRDPASVGGLDERQAPAAVNTLDDQLCYLLYTSGSTGTPKGVGVRHGGLRNYVQALQHWLPWADIQQVALLSTPAADLGYTSLFGALCLGRTLHLLPADWALDSQAVARYMQAQRIDLLKLVPSHLAALLEGAGADVLPRRALVLGGEALPASLLAQVRQALPSCEVFNHYGPTETTIGVLSTSLAHTSEQAPIALGQAMPNLRLSVVDEQHNLQPQGLYGELLVEGVALAQGYWQRPGLTAERFVPSLNGAAGARCYRTGDRVRVQADALQFAGRLDDQVKVRGHRIEPAEIAAALKRLAGVADAFVGLCPQVDGLVAWVVGQGSAALEPGAVLRQLAGQVADYMVPAHCVVLEHMPLTANGKTDRRALPAPTPAPERPYQAPQGDCETRVAAIWQAVLKRERIGRHDDFFELGGHSLLVMSVVSRMQLELGMTMSPQLLFTHTTLAALVEHLEPQAARLDDARLSRLEDLFDEVDA
ncbi:amino acid adenylation domain-containing protein [Pseudomonas xanthosomatis]|uniref:non-ribosomal peptide synthetase n=1 Tax=Pseudomonas xanthosomatis TaxID=2842356 RepID=UPI001C3D318D|nr:non-ribosomal peptide synthetase [Pseudomonas xanthosomatis]QXH44122.1 amino acid adenylation domain-containing protein [Pseudomonas xanthosomatis]